MFFFLFLSYLSLNICRELNAKCTKWMNWNCPKLDNLHFQKENKKSAPKDKNRSWIQCNVSSWSFFVAPTSLQNFALQNRKQKYKTHRHQTATSDAIFLWLDCFEFGHKKMSSCPLNEQNKLTETYLPHFHPVGHILMPLNARARAHTNAEHMTWKA